MWQVELAQALLSCVLDSLPNFRWLSCTGLCPTPPTMKQQSSSEDAITVWLEIPKGTLVHMGISSAKLCMSAGHESCREYYSSSLFVYTTSLYVVVCLGIGSTRENSYEVIEKYRRAYGSLRFGCCGQIESPGRYPRVML